MQLDLFYFDGCPSREKVMDNMKAVLAAEGLEADINLLRVRIDAKTRFATRIWIRN